MTQQQADRIAATMVAIVEMKLKGRNLSEEEVREYLRSFLSADILRGQLSTLITVKE